MIRWWMNWERVLVLTHIEMKIRRRLGGYFDESAEDDAVTNTTSQQPSVTGDYDQDSSDVEDVGHADYDRWWPFGEGDDEIVGQDDYNMTFDEGRVDISPWHSILSQNVERWN